MTPNKLDLDRIEGLARAATPGPWQHGYWSGKCHKKHAHHGPSEPDPCIYDYSVFSGGHGVASSTERVDVLGSDYDGLAAKEADLAYIAAVNPDTILSLISYARELDGTGWQLIANAPRHGERILGGYWHKGAWVTRVVHARGPGEWLSDPGDWLVRPTHWRPLPAPPALSRTQKMTDTPIDQKALEAAANGYWVQSHIGFVCPPWSSAPPEAKELVRANVNATITAYLVALSRRVPASGELEPVGEASNLAGLENCTYAVFQAAKVPVGTKLYDRPASLPLPVAGTPEGWRLVPVEPTDRMRAAGQWTISDNLTVSVCVENNRKAAEIYAAMISVAPPAPEGKAEPDEAKELRQIISDCAAALGTGAFVAPTASLDFMRNLPGEIRAAMARALSTPPGAPHE